MMKKFVCIAMMLMLSCMLPVCAYASSSDGLVASTPVISTTSDNLVSAYSYVKNNSSSEKNEKMVLYNSSVIVSSIEKTLKTG